MHVTATHAKNKFGAICAHAKTEPVYVEKDGKVDTVILSAKQFEALSGAVRGETMEERRQAFGKKYKKWIDEQNARFEEHGLWCDDLRVW
ncbi:MAG: type II toxin-antitoxin system CcdA family antitoxin [Burkholderiales bacterium]